MSRYEELSRLLEGDLPPDEAAALREQIARDPELRAHWEAMQALPHLLMGLPEEAPPPGLNAAVLGGRPAAEPKVWRRWWPVAAGVIAAAAALALVIPREPATVLLAQGEQLVEGDVRVLAGDCRVDVDGRAVVFVEPPAGWDTTAASSIPAAASALSGASVTVRVEEGSAVLRTAGGAAVTVGAGETHTVGASSQGGPSTTAPAAAVDPAMPQRIALLEAELEKLRFEQKLARGRLALLEGEASEWPADVPAAARPAELEAALRAALAADARYELLELDCSEFPCLAALRMDAPGPDGEAAAQDFVDRFKARQFRGDAHAQVWVTRGDEAPDSPVYVGFGFIPAGWEDGAMDTRLRYRMDGMMSAVEPPLGEP